MTRINDEGLLVNSLILKVGHYTLRGLQEEDADSIHNLINDWNVVRMLSKFPFPYPKTLLNQWITAIIQQMKNSEAYHFAIIDESTIDKPIVGCIGLSLDLTNHSAKIGYWVGQKFWRQGIATQVLQRVSSWALANLNIEYIRTTVAEDNLASIAVLKRCDYQSYDRGYEKFIARNIEQPVLHFALRREDICQNGPSMMPNLVTLPVLLVVAAALIDIDGRVLLTRRPEGKSMAGLWEFPGGKVEVGESPEEAIIRELKEELDVNVAHSCLAPFTFASHCYEKFHLLMPLYVCHRWKNTPSPKEGQQLAWVNAEQLDHYPVLEADKPLLPMLKDLLF